MLRTQTVRTENTVPATVSSGICICNFTRSKNSVLVTRGSVAISLAGEASVIASTLKYVHLQQQANQAAQVVAVSLLNVLHRRDNLHCYLHSKSSEVFLFPAHYLCRSRMGWHTER